MSKCSLCSLHVQACNSWEQCTHTRTRARTHTHTRQSWQVIDPLLHCKVTNAQPDTVTGLQQLAQCARSVKCGRCAAQHTATYTACHCYMATHAEARFKTPTCLLNFPSSSILALSFSSNFVVCHLLLLITCKAKACSHCTVMLESSNCLLRPERYSYKLEQSTNCSAVDSLSVIKSWSKGHWPCASCIQSATCHNARTKHKLTL